MTEVSPTSAQQPWEVEVSVSTGGTEKLRSRGDSARPLPVRAERAVGSAAQRGGPPLPRPRPSDVIRRGRGLARGVPRLPANPGAGSGHLPDGKAPRGLCPARPAGGSAASHRGHLARTRLFSELLQTVVGGAGPALQSIGLRTPPRVCGPSQLLWGPPHSQMASEAGGQLGEMARPLHLSEPSRSAPHPGTGGMEVRAQPGWRAAAACVSAEGQPSALQRGPKRGGRGDRVGIRGQRTRTTVCPVS